MTVAVLYADPRGPYPVQRGLDLFAKRYRGLWD